MATVFSTDQEVMQHAIHLARAGFGFVEPNPMVGAVIVSSDRTLIAEGIHQKFGEAHAEVNAIRAAGRLTAGADLFVSLEPCSHFGKTPPCADAVIEAGFRRVMIGCPDPAPHVAGKGIERLREAGMEVVVGVCESDAARLIAPFRKLMVRGQPWIHAKWAMTLDGRIAARTGHSQWISCEESRDWVHDLRGRMDAIITGAGTIRADDPVLTARPPGPRTPLRVIIDSTGGSLTEDKQLVRTAADAPILVCVSERCMPSQLERLHRLGLPTFQTFGSEQVDMNAVLSELGRRGCTQALLEAGASLLGTFFDAGAVDEVHAFLAPKIVGGQSAVSPIGGTGLAAIPAEANVRRLKMTQIGRDLLVEGDCGNPDAEIGTGRTGPSID